MDSTHAFEIFDSSNFSAAVQLPYDVFRNYTREVCTEIVKKNLIIVANTVSTEIDSLIDLFRPW